MCGSSPQAIADTLLARLLPERADAVLEDYAVLDGPDLERPLLLASWTRHAVSELTVHDLVLARGASEADWERIKRPIGLKFGAKTPAELAISIVAELVDVRYTQRYSPEARARHEESLGR